jgi:hypothetical protein
VGFLGVAICLGAIALRLAGMYTVSGYSLTAVLQGGSAVVIIGCFLLLQKPRRP